MFIDIWGIPTIIATAEQINTAFNLAEEFDRANGAEIPQQIITELSMELDQQFLEETNA